MGEMAHGQSAYTPARRHRAQWLEREAAVLKLGVWNGEPPRPEFAAAPQQDVEIEHASAPAAAWPPSELALDLLQAPKQIRRLGIAFDQRDGIGIIAAARPNGAAEHDRRGVEESEVRIEPGDRRFDHIRRAAIPPVSPVRPDPDGVEVGHACQLLSPSPPRKRGSRSLEGEKKEVGLSLSRE